VRQIGPEEAVELVGEQLHHVGDVVETPGGVQSTSGLQQRTAHEPGRPVPAETTDVVALTVSVAGLDDQFVEERSLVGRHPGPERGDVRFAELDVGTRGEQRGELERRRLGQGRAVDVVARDRPPGVQLEPGVDHGADFRPQCPDVVDRSERFGSGAFPDGSGDRLQHRGRLDRRR
jgi:hypothetical protein